MIRYIRWRLACRRLARSMRPDPDYRRRRKEYLATRPGPRGRMAILMARDLREAGL